MHCLEVMEVHRTAGDVDYNARVVAPDMQTYDTIALSKADRVIKLKNVTSVRYRNDKSGNLRRQS